MWKNKLILFPLFLILFSACTVSEKQKEVVQQQETKVAKEIIRSDFQRILDSAAVMGCQTNDDGRKK